MLSSDDPYAFPEPVMLKEYYTSVKNIAINEANILSELFIVPQNKWQAIISEYNAPVVPLLGPYINTKTLFLHNISYIIFIYN